MKPTDHKFEHGGKTFVLHVADNPGDAEPNCKDCAFVRDVDACSGQNSLCDELKGNWQEAAPLAVSKASNPKDSIGIKKAPLSVVPLPVVAELGVAMLEGAAKYGRHNFRAVGVRESVYFDATMRHLIAYWEGEDTDPDSGMPHLTKAMASLAVWRDAQIQGMATDDRPPHSMAFYGRLNDATAALLEKHKDKTPKHYTEKNL